MNIQMTIKLDPQWGEWVVRLFYEGEHYKDLDYHTSDLEDAKLTALAMRRDFENKRISAFMGNAKQERKTKS